MEDVFLVWFVVVRCYYEYVIDVGFVGKVGEFDGFFGGIGVGIGDDWDVVFCVFDDGVDNIEVFFVCESGGFICGIGGDEVMDV